MTALEAFYRSYTACLNQQDWNGLGDFVAEDVCYNDKIIGLAGYHQMLMADFQAIPDLEFRILQLMAQAPDIGVRLRFDCHPVGLLFGMAVNGRRLQFDEHVFYRLKNGKIHQVWSMIDKGAIAAQLKILDLG